MEQIIKERLFKKKVEKALSRARAEGFPFRMTLEEV